MIEFRSNCNEEVPDCVREHTAKDIAEVEHLIFSDPWSTQAVLETMNNPQALILEAREDQTLVGYVIFYYVLDEGEIARIAVSPEYRRRGVGKDLLHQLRKISEEKGITKWLLDVRSSNEGAVAFYRGYGFAQDGTRRNFYTNPTEDAILMSHTL